MRAPPRTPTFMKSHSIFIALVLASLVLSSCFSTGLQFRDSFSGRVTTEERVRNAALDVVTLPVQIPVLAGVALAEGID